MSDRKDLIEGKLSQEITISKRMESETDADHAKIAAWVTMKKVIEHHMEEVTSLKCQRCVHKKYDTEEFDFATHAEENRKIFRTTLGCGDNNRVRRGKCEIPDLHYLVPHDAPKKPMAGRFWRDRDNKRWIFDGSKWSCLDVIGDSLSELGVTASEASKAAVKWGGKEITGIWFDEAEDIEIGDSFFKTTELVEEIPEPPINKDIPLGVESGSW